MHPASYDKYPEVRVSGFEHQAWQGWPAIKQAVSERLSASGKTVLVIDCYPGVQLDELHTQLIEQLNPQHIINAESARLSEQRPAGMAPLNVLIQVNISDEQSKSGIALDALDSLAAEVSALPNLCLRGLMAIPAPEHEYARQFAVASQMAVALARLKAEYPTVDTLSLGMSDDMEAAIAAGSTMVRIGTAIFGARDYTKK